MCGPYSSSRWAHERSMGDELDSFEKLRNEIDEVGMKKYGKLYENSFDDEWLLTCLGYHSILMKNFIKSLNIS